MLIVNSYTVIILIKPHTLYVGKFKTVFTHANAANIDKIYVYMYVQPNFGLIKSKPVKQLVYSKAMSTNSIMYNTYD